MGLYQLRKSKETPRSLLSYLGLKGYGKTENTTGVTVLKNITAGLAYWDIFKNYHANKQEKNAYYIGTNTNITKIENVYRDWERNNKKTNRCNKHIK